MNIITSVIRFYVEGFRNMTIGKTLWTIIIIKLFIMFFILKWFFFPDFLGQFGEDEAVSEYISSELVDRAINP